MGVGHLLTLIAVSSFGKGLRWDFLTKPAEAIFCPRGGSCEGGYNSCSVIGSTTVNVLPCPMSESTHIRPW
jgi:hypothetical protein